MTTIWASFSPIRFGIIAALVFGRFGTSPSFETIPTLHIKLMGSFEIPTKNCFFWLFTYSLDTNTFYLSIGTNKRVGLYRIRVDTDQLDGR